MKLSTVVSFMVTFLLVGLVFSTRAQEMAAAQLERSSLSKSISIYPNPAIDYVEVDLDYLRADKVTITLHNIIGNDLNAETEVVDEHKVRIRVKEFAAGYYLISIRDEGTRFKGTFKFLKR